MKKELINKYWTVLIICLSIVIIAGSIGVLKNRHKELVKVRIAVAEQPVFALVFVADRKGYFKEEGLDVELKRHLLGRDALGDIKSDEADMATAFDVPVINQIQKGENLGILTTLHTSTKNQVVAAIKSKGIKTAVDLRGKRVAMTRGTSTELFLNFYLMEQGIDSSEVRRVSLEPEQLLPGLKSGEVDAVVLFSPYTYQLKKEFPGDQIAWLYSDVFPEESVLVAEKNVIERDKNKVKSVLRALYKAEKFIKSNREEAIELVSKSLPNYDMDAAVEGWDNFNFSLEISNMNLNNMEKQINFFTKGGGYFSDAPYLRNYFLPDYLEEVKPEGVTLF